MITLVLAGIACDDEVTQPEIKTPAGPAFKTLDTGDNLLYNLELAFNVYDEAQYDKLLDENFVFWFSAADFSSGRTPEHWDSTAEMTSYNNFFDDTRTANKVLNRDIRLGLESATWTAIAPDDPGSYPGETWYESVVTYDLNVLLDTNPDLTLIAMGVRAKFIVRRDDALGHWTLIRWYDDVSGLRAGAATGAAVETATWGVMKALYGS
jgi:hypothetical protein